MRIGYARVSTQDQNLDLQQDTIAAAGCEKVIVKTASSKSADRTGLTRSLGGRCLKLVVLASRLVSTGSVHPSVAPFYRIR